MGTARALLRLEVHMKNRDELEGKSESIKGKVEQAAGDLTDNEELRERGAARSLATV
jgi:uncharacterized protein YjbJ (UPF0337 family)